MAESRKVIKIFLASPSDLRDERRAAKRVVDEFNSNWADHLGYHVELVGWEDTVSVYGRPQAAINKDLERCEYFVGMLGKRWGTQPDEAGIYTSGFEEEFEISVARRSEHGTPEISLFFREIESDQLQDPGNELKKVLAFQDRIKAERKLLFERFSTVDEFVDKIRRCVARYVQAKRAAESLARAEESQSSSSENLQTESASETGQVSVSSLSAEGAKFLRNFVAKSEFENKANSIAAADIARLRLLGCMFRYPGNDERTLGVRNWFEHWMTTFLVIHIGTTTSCIGWISEFRCGGIWRARLPPSLFLGSGHDVRMQTSCGIIEEVVFRRSIAGYTYPWRDRLTNHSVLGAYLPQHHRNRQEREDHAGRRIQEMARG